MTDEERDLLVLLLARPRSRLKTYARMRKRDRMFAAWATGGTGLVPVTQAVKFELELPLLEADQDEREQIEPWWVATSSRVAREIVPHYTSLGPNASTLAREDTLVRISTKAAIDVFAGLGLIMAWEWVTQRDARVCDRCGPLDGRVMPSQAVAPLPLHPRCRCGLRPVIERVPMQLALSP